MKLVRLTAARAFVCMVALGLCGSVQAQPKPDLYVLAVGIDKYQAPTNNLRGCVNDATGMADVWQAQRGKKFGQARVTTLADGQATRTAIVDRLKALETRGRAGDWYVIVLSGHGGIQRDQWDFLAQDNSGLADSVILGTADRLADAGKKVVIIIDACHAGVLRYAAGRVLNRHVDPARGGIILMVSSMPDQLSSALGNYSAFARAVEDGLRGLADYDGDGVITLKELRRYTYNRVYELCLKQREFPGVTVSYQDSAIDASLSIPEGVVLVEAKRPAPEPMVDDGPESKSSVLIGKTWTVTTAGSKLRPPTTFELKLDTSGTYRATVKQGIRPTGISNGAYKVMAKAVQLIHHQGTDRLEVVSVAPGTFQFRFQGRLLTARSDSHAGEQVVLDVSSRLLLEDPRDRVRKDSPHKVYRLNLEVGATYVIDLQSAEFDSFLRLEDANGTQVAEDDDGGGGRNARIRYAPPRSGEYRIIATTYDRGSGLFHLHVAKLSGPRTSDQPVAAAVILNVAGQLTEKDPRDRARINSFARVYNVELKTGVPYTIDMVGTDFDTYLRLENDAGMEVAADDDSGAGLNARIKYTPTRAGTYRIYATSFQRATGRFTLTVRAPGVSPVVAGGIAVTLTAGSARIAGQLTAADGLDTSRTNSHRKVFLVTLQGGKECTIFLKSADFDSYLRVEDATGKQLAFDDDGGGGHDSRIVFAPPATGTYRIIATTFTERATGGFNLSIGQR